MTREREKERRRERERERERESESEKERAGDICEKGSERGREMRGREG